MTGSELHRRTLLAAFAGVPLGTVLADAGLTRAAAETTETIRITTPAGRQVAAALRKPDTVPAPAVMLVHEWWGLNDQIKAVAVELASRGYLALAVDLFQGRVATSVEDARDLSQNVKPEEAADTLAAWGQWLTNHPDGNRKMGVVGWCFGGGWALTAATLAPFDATVVYYGRVNLPDDQLAKLKGPVLGHFATNDQFITKDIVTQFEAGMKRLGKPATVYWYDAGHAFANPTGDNYNQADAQLAWRRTLDFFGKRLR